MVKHLYLSVALSLFGTCEASTLRGGLGMQQCLQYLKAGKAGQALCALQAMRDAQVQEEYELDSAHLLAVAQEMVNMQVGKLSAMLQEALGECIGLLNAMELQTGVAADVLIARARDVIRLALSILVMHALENISLHIPQA